MSVTQAQYTRRLDAAGEFSAQFPLTDPQTAALQVGRVYQHIHEGLGFAFAGSIEHVDKVPVDSLEISGDSMLVELLHDNTLLNRSYTSTSVNAIIDDLLSGTGWTRTGSVTDLVTVRFDGESKLRAILLVLDQAGAHCREVVSGAGGGPLTKQLEIGAFGATPTVVCSNGAADALGIEDYGLANIPDGAFSVADTTDEVWNNYVPLGAGDGAAQLTLVQQTRLPNMITAGQSFEPDLSDWTVNASGGTIDDVDTHSVHGSRAVYVDGSGGDNTRLDQSIGVVAGRVYRGRVWAWALQAHLTLRFEWHNASHAAILSADYETQTTGEWEALDSGEITAPSGATHLHYFLHTEAVGEGYFDLARHWRTAGDSGQPYDVLTALTDPTKAHAQVNWYIVDPTSVATYGSRIKPFVAKDIVPLAFTKPAFQVAANALYDLAAAQLDRTKDKQTAYGLACHGLDPSVLPGDLVRLRYKGMARRTGYDDDYMYVDVDEDVYVLERTTAFGDVVSDQLAVSNLDRQLQNEDEVVIGKLEDTVRAFKTHVQTSVGVWAEHIGPDMVDGSHDFDFDARVPDNVVQLLRCLISITPGNIRSPTQNTTGESTHTHGVNNVTSGGGSGTGASGAAGGQSSTTPSSDGGDSEPTDNRTTGLGLHQHEYGSVQPGSVSAPTVWRQVAYFKGTGGFFYTKIGQDDTDSPILITRVDSGHEHSYVIPSHAHGTHDHGSHHHGTHAHPSHTHPTHTHTISDVTSDAGSSHTHTAEFGIFEGTAAAGVQILINGVNRTTALGGPWSAKVENVDITRYLLDDDGVVVLGDHTVKLTSTQLGRLEARLEWAVAVAALAQ